MSSCFWKVWIKILTKNKPFREENLIQNGKLNFIANFISLHSNILKTEGATVRFLQGNP